MKKYLLIFVGLLSLGLILSGCGKKTTKFESKTNEGIGAIFDEEFGFYDKDASIIQLDDITRIVYYTTNKDKNIEGDVIAYRKGTKDGDKWNWSNKQIVLEPNANSWDSKRVNNPDVIKGEFSYNSEVYNYLMAYSGNNIEANKNYQIGFALAKNPEGPWIKFENQPFIAYDSNTYGSQFGAGQPSLVSYDEKGKVRLFYTLADELLTSTRLMELDLSDMNNVKGNNAYLTVSVKGLEDKDLSILPMLNNADFAFDKDNDTLYVVRDRNPLATTNPIIADSLQLAKSNIDILYKIEPTEPTWTLIDKSINDSDTAIDDLTGWQRIYSGSIVTDAFGNILSSDNIEVCFSSSAIATNADDTTYKFTPALHVITVENK